MKPSRSRPIPGPRAVVSALRGVAIAAGLLLTACSYGLSGGGGFPSAIRTVCIEPFENQTDHGELTNEVFTQLTRDLPGRLGLRPADCKGGADAIIRGKILRYDDSAVAYTANSNPYGQPVTDSQTKQITVTLGVQIIDSKRNVYLWESSAVNGLGSYKPPDDATGRKLAVGKLVQAIVDGAQSQW